MHTISGKEIDLYNPTMDALCINDIAHALSNVIRFGGHANFPYSVLAHSLAMWEQAPDKYKMEALLHDAAEAYTGDVIYPLKETYPEIVELEDTIAAMIFDKYAPNTYYPMRIGSKGQRLYVKTPIVKDLDRRMGIGESVILRPAVSGRYDPMVDAMIDKYKYATPKDFIEIYERELKNG